MRSVGRSSVGCAVVALAMLLVTAVVRPTIARAQSSPPDSTAVPHDSTAVTPPAPAPAPAPVTTAPPPAAGAAHAAPAQDAGMFSKGKRGATAVVGWGHTFGQDYLLIG